MCSSTQLVKKSRHRFEIPLLIISATLTLLVALGAIGVGLFKDDVREITEQTFIEDYKLANPDADTMTDVVILENIPEDDKSLLATIEKVSLPLVLGAPILLVLGMIFAIGKVFGDMRGNGIKITPQQFGKVHQLWTELADELDFKVLPDLYVKNGNGALNAFATCVPGYRRFGVIYSDILERALANDDMDSLRFILGHELGHIRLGHVFWWYALLTSITSLPIINYFIGLPLSRAREYGCDKVGHHLSKDTQCKGLVMLASGKHLYKQVDLEEYEKNHIDTRNIWDTVNNATLDHPNISWRIAAIREKRHGDLLFPKKK